MFPSKEFHICVVISIKFNISMAVHKGLVNECIKVLYQCTYKISSAHKDHRLIISIDEFIHCVCNLIQFCLFLKIIGFPHTSAICVQSLIYITFKAKDSTKCYMIKGFWLSFFIEVAYNALVTTNCL